MFPADDTDELVRRAGLDDPAARSQLLAKHQDQLRRMISIRMDPRLSARLDPSDVLQDVLAEAAERLGVYARTRPMPFYPWLRRLAWDHLIDLYERHLLARKRSVLRERDFGLVLSDQSAVDLASQFAEIQTSASAQLMRQEQYDRARDALAKLDPDDREILVMRHLEQMKISEIAVLLGIGESAVKMRRLRAMQRLRDLLDADSFDAGYAP